MEFIAHIRQSDGKIQTVEEHLLAVKCLAERIGNKIGVSHIAGLAGMLHDLGKFTLEFRNYILKAVYDNDSPPKRGEVDHSTAGGKLLYDFLKRNRSTKYREILAEIVGNAIISHHSYLHDFLGPDAKSDYLRRVRDTDPPGYEQARAVFFDRIMDDIEFEAYTEAAAKELEAYLDPTARDNWARIMFLTKYVFSALIDADRTNTRAFEEGELSESEISRRSLFENYYSKLMVRIAKLQETAKGNAVINSLRMQMSEMCESSADKLPGIRLLSIPTGGGKTLGSLRYALKHAIRYDLDRIIYIVPYTTIIEQNANEVRQIIQDDEHLLEHHSNMIEDIEDDVDDDVLDKRWKLRLAKDNWESPVIFTTMVQFLDTFYARSSRNVRRLHNLSKAVIIFDEVQKVPVTCVSLFNFALNFLEAQACSSLLLCTATQPALEEVRHKLNVNVGAEIIEQLPDVVRAFKRTEIVDRTQEGSHTTEQLADFVKGCIQDVCSVLVILNTKSVVRKLYEHLSDEVIPVYHLSTSMCPAHRNLILDKVRNHLNHKEKVICVSTQLIEAGVDISFDCVIRSLAGLDSIAQAAGRCNRHGEDTIRQVYVIEHGEENLSNLKEIAKGKEVAKKILLSMQRDPTLYDGDLLSASAMKRYFEDFYSEIDNNLDYPIRELGVNATQLLMSERKANPFFSSYQTIHKSVPPLLITHSHRTAAEHFRVIDDSSTTVIVPFEGGREIIADLNGVEKIDDLSNLLRRAQPYVVNLHRQQLDQLSRNEGLIGLLDGQVLALKEGAYNEEFGVDLDNESATSFYNW